MRVKFLSTPEFDEAIHSGQLYRKFWEGDPPDWEEVLSTEIYRAYEIFGGYPEEELFIRNEHWANDSITFEVWEGIFEDSLLEKLDRFLIPSACSCVMMSIQSHRQSVHSCEYWGRIAYRLDKIVVEESLKPWWDSKFG